MHVRTSVCELHLSVKKCIRSLGVTKCASSFKMHCLLHILHCEGYPFVTKPRSGFLESIVVCYRDLQLVINIGHS